MNAIRYDFSSRLGRGTRADHIPDACVARLREACRGCVGSSYASLYLSLSRAVSASASASASASTSAVAAALFWFCDPACDSPACDGSGPNTSPRRPRLGGVPICIANDNIPCHTYTEESTMCTHEYSYEYGYILNARNQNHSYDFYINDDYDSQMLDLKPLSLMANGSSWKQDGMP
ncbi:hypothetical protein KQX54_007978 [Cotesia glomerata]|uniref:Uncharacterized protein n=1 Tax=Cotesia glomerata TaxID=32391 RepID=A0AAV7J8A7_COTGL|nr:hypothetical protein KQX54_007978 [Cotesia glomerata]